ncbi:MAG: hypothetical protein HZB59_05835 [Ignavibacteriales bacterium]|nr:hypothetical protein [Ignavibacteriales bacterium]
MKKIFAIIFLSAIVFTLQAQVPVKKDLMPLVDNYPYPPANAKEAFSKVTVTSEYGTLKCGTDKLFEAIDKELKYIEAEYTAQEKNPSNFMPKGIDPNDMKKMADPEMKKKMKSMSKEDKMKMAMEMMKSMPGAASGEMDPPPVRDALNEWQKIYNDTQNEFNRSVAEQQEEIKLGTEYEKQHNDINEWEQAEIKKLPQISGGEMSAPDPAMLKALNLKAADKHIAAANKRLEQIKTRWQASVDRIKSRYTTFYKKLVAADYASGTKNFSSKKILSDAQMIIFKDIASQVQISRKAYEDAAMWQARKNDIENKKY